MKLSTKPAPLVSVILTSYNHATHVGRAIESILDQTYQNLEIFVVDDASTDHSADVIRGFKSDRLKLFLNSQKRTGTENLNFVLQHHVSGQYVAIHHSDDVWHSTKIERQVELITTHPEAAAVFTGISLIDEQGNPVADRTYSSFLKSEITPSELRNRLFVQGNCLCHPSALIDFEKFKSVGFYDLGFRQLGDYNAWLKLAAKFDLHFLQNELTYYRVNFTKPNTSLPSIQNANRSVSELLAALLNFMEYVSPSQAKTIFPEIPDNIANVELKLAFANRVLNADFSGMHNLAAELLTVRNLTGKSQEARMPGIFSNEAYIALTGNRNTLHQQEVGRSLLSIRTAGNQGGAHEERRFPFIYDYVVNHEYRIPARGRTAKIALSPLVARCDLIRIHEFSGVDDLGNKLELKLVKANSVHQIDEDRFLLLGGASSFIFDVDARRNISIRFSFSVHKAPPELLSELTKPAIKRFLKRLPGLGRGLRFMRSAASICNLGIRAKTERA